MSVTVKPTANDVADEGRLKYEYFGANMGNGTAMLAYIGSRVDDVDAEVQLAIGATNYAGGSDVAKQELVKSLLHKAEMYLTLGRLWQAIKAVMDSYDEEALPPEFVHPEEAAANRDYYLKEGRAIIDRYETAETGDEVFAKPYFGTAGAENDASVLQEMLEAGEA